MKHKGALTFTAGTMAVVMLAACSSSSGSSSKASSDRSGSTSGVASSSGSASGSVAALAANSTDPFAKFEAVPSKIAVTTELSKKPPTGIKVVYLNNGQTFAQQFSGALKAAVAPLGWTASDLKFDPSNPQAVGSAFQTAVNQGYNVIEVQGLDSALYAKYVPEALAKKIVVVDTVSTGATVPGVVYVERSQVTGAAQATIVAGTILADAAQRKVTAHVLNIGSVLYQSLFGPLFSITSNDLTSASNCGNCTSDLFSVSAQATVSNSFAPAIVSYLQSHPNINYINVPLGAFALGLLPAIKQAGLGTKIRLIGATPVPTQIAALKANDPQVLGWIANDIYVGAWDSVDAAARKFVGDNASVYANKSAAKWLLTSKSGSGPAGLVPAPTAPVDYIAQFKKNWHVS